MGEQFLEGQDAKGADNEASLENAGVFVKPEAQGQLSLFDALAPAPESSSVDKDKTDSNLEVEPADRAGIRLSAEISGPRQAATATLSDTSDYANRSAFSKVADISARSIANAPSMYLSELKDDFTERPGKVLATAGISTGAGFGMTYLLKRAPGKGKAALLGLAAVQTLHYGKRLTDFLSDAAGAQSIQERDNLVRQGTLGLAREGTMFTEALPGVLLGGKLAVDRFGKPPLFQSVEDGLVMSRAKLNETSFMQAARDTRLGRSVGRASAMHGPGSVELPMSIKVAPTAESPATRINFLAIDEALGGAGAHRFRGVEEARLIDLINNRASGKILGSAQRREVSVGYVNGRTDTLIHNHRDGKFLASPKDIAAHDAPGMIYSGDELIIYMGKRSQASPTLQQLRINRTSETAVMEESLTPWVDSDMGIVSKTNVAFDDAIASLKSGLDVDVAKAWAQIRLLRGGS